MCGSIVAVVGNEIVIELPENVKSDAAVRCGHVVVCFEKEITEVGDGMKMFAQETMTHSVCIQQTHQLLQ